MKKDKKKQKKTDKKKKTNKKKGKKDKDKKDKDKKDKKKKKSASKKLETPKTGRDAWRMAEDVGIEQVLQTDTLALLKENIHHGLNENLQKVFKIYCSDEDDEVLVSRLINESEEQLNSFYEKNFSNNEIGILFKLRKSRHVSYEDAFQRFRKDHRLEDLVSRLKDVIEENLALSTNKFADGAFGRKRSTEEET